MRMTWTVGILMLFFIGTGISLTLENEYIGAEVQYEDVAGNPCEASAEDAEPVGVISQFKILIQPGFVKGGDIPIIGFFIMVWGWLQAFWSAFWWDYSFFTGTWMVLKYLGWSISIGVVVAMVMAIRGVGSA